MKILYNNCYGAFKLSDEAIKLYLEKINSNDNIPDTSVSKLRALKASCNSIRL